MGETLPAERLLKLKEILAHVRALIREQESRLANSKDYAQKLELAVALGHDMETPPSIPGTRKAEKKRRRCRLCGVAFFQPVPSRKCPDCEAGRVPRHITTIRSEAA